MRCTSLALLASMFATSTTGCYMTWDVAPKELMKLDGFRPSKEIALVDKRGEGFVFDDDAVLRVEGGGARPLETRLSAIQIRESTLVGVTPEHTFVTIDLGRLDSALVRKKSAEKTAGAIAAISVGGLVAAVVTACAAVALLHPSAAGGTN